MTSPRPSIALPVLQPHGSMLGGTMGEKKEKCGVFGVWGAEQAATVTYYGLYAQQHRGQEATGILQCCYSRCRCSCDRPNVQRRRAQGGNREPANGESHTDR